MKSQCSICSELFTKTCDMSATICGHVFHYACLQQWLEQSRTCPKCRGKVTSKTIVPKLFFDPVDEGSEDDDEDVLRNTNNELQAQLRSAEDELSTLHEVIKFKDVDLLDFESQLKTSWSNLAEVRLQSQRYKTKMLFLETENTRLRAAEDELVVARKDLESFSTLQSMLDGSSSQTEKILNSYSKDPASMKQLATYCSLLQKELTDAKNIKAKMKEELKIMKLDAKVLLNNCSKKQASLTMLTSDNACMKQSLAATEQELVSAQDKIEQLHRKLQDLTKSANTIFDRIILESPAPQSSVPSFETSSDSSPPPPIMSRAEKILAMNKRKRRVNENGFAHLISSNTKSMKLTNKSEPYIKPSSTSAAAAASKSIIELSSPSSSSSSSPDDPYQHFTIFKRQRGTSAASAPHLAGSSTLTTRALASRRDCGYDGYGGHSKPEVFPTGKRVPVNHRPKLTKGKSSTNISDFFVELE